MGNSRNRYYYQSLFDLKIWMVDPGIVLQKIVVETREIAPSYLGPPQSYNRDLY
jgi:hypothetical protein